MDYTQKIKEYFDKEKQVIDSVSKEDLSEIMNVLECARKERHTIFIMGNGGSAATASHFVCDFNKGIADGKEEGFVPYKFLCLNDNTPSLMAISNDISYDDAFVFQLKNFLNDGDVVIGISGSGNSPNVIKAIEYANSNGATTIGFSGYSGGKLKRIVKHSVHVPIDDTQITEDVHMIFDHCMMKILWACAK